MHVRLEHCRISIITSKRVSNTTLQTHLCKSENSVLWVDEDLAGMQDAIKSQTKDSVPQKDRKWDGASRGGVIGNWLFYAGVRSLGLRVAYASLFPVALYYLLFDSGSRRARPRRT